MECTPIVLNPDQIIQLPVPPNNQEVVETQPVLPAEDELVPVLQPMPIFPDHTAILPIPPRTESCSYPCRSDTVYEP